MTLHEPACLIILRHAKAAWPDGVRDQDRPLSARGRRDAPAAGRWLRGAGYRPEAVVCSPARRTRQTLELLSPELAGRPTVVYDPRVYEAQAAQLLDVVRETDESCRTVLLIGHSPAVEELTLELAGRAVTGDALSQIRAKFPTSGIAVLQLPGRWEQLVQHSAVLLAFAVPRGTQPMS
ncbi:histidine phosphatase family protein [Streptomyces sp. NPDC004680]|uniref:SixA phosphatase family protein n=1 Tax=Streptomyces sp. NPDC004680 TaxID=3154287 RepID=UPI0033B66909